jgi:hypothetical protein
MIGVGSGVFSCDIVKPVRYGDLAILHRMGGDAAAISSISACRDPWPSGGGAPRESKSARATIAARIIDKAWTRSAKTAIFPQ